MRGIAKYRPFARWCNNLISRGSFPPPSPSSPFLFSTRGTTTTTTTTKSWERKRTSAPKFQLLLLLLLLLLYSFFFSLAYTAPRSLANIIYIYADAIVTISLCWLLLLCTLCSEDGQWLSFSLILRCSYYTCVFYWCTS